MQRLTNPSDSQQTFTRLYLNIGIDIDNRDGFIFKHPSDQRPRTLLFAKFPDFINDKDANVFRDPYMLQCLKGKTVRPLIEGRSGFNL